MCSLFKSPLFLWARGFEWMIFFVLAAADTSLYLCVHARRNRKEHKADMYKRLPKIIIIV